MASQRQPSRNVWMIILCATITCASQAGLALAHPDALCVGLGPSISANYAPWTRDRFVPVDPRLGTIAVQTSGAPMDAAAINTPVPPNAPALIGTSPDVPPQAQRTPTDKANTETKPTSQPTVSTTQTPAKTAMQTLAATRTNTPTTMPTSTPAPTGTPTTTPNPPSTPSGTPERTSTS